MISDGKEFQIDGAQCLDAFSVHFCGLWVVSSTGFESLISIDDKEHIALNDHLNMMELFKAQDADFVVNPSLKRKPMKFSEQRRDMISLSLLQDEPCRQHDFECAEAW